MTLLRGHKHDHNNDNDQRLKNDLAPSVRDQQIFKSG